MQASGVSSALDKQLATHRGTQPSDRQARRRGQTRARLVRAAAAILEMPAGTLAAHPTATNEIDAIVTFVARHRVAHRGQVGQGGLALGGGDRECAQRAPGRREVLVRSDESAGDVGADTEEHAAGGRADNHVNARITGRGATRVGHVAHVGEGVLVDEVNGHRQPVRLERPEAHGPGIDDRDAEQPGIRQLLDEESFARLLRARDLIHARYGGTLRIEDLAREALGETGDRIRLSVKERKLDLLVSEALLSKRRATWKPVVPPERGYRKLYLDHVLQADAGCDFDFLASHVPVKEPEIH